MIKSKISRRHFAKLSCFGVGSAAGGFWLSQSNSFAARFIRERWNEIGLQTQKTEAKPSPTVWLDNQVTAAWLGHSTVLINFFGISILTDPVLFGRVGANLGFGTLGPKRLTASALGSADLPHIDLVLLSHAHMDHFDIPSLCRLGSSTRAVSAKKTSDLFRSTGISQVRELGWGDRTTFHTSNGEIQVEAFEVNHWGARWRNDKQRGFNGYILSREGRKIIFGGDTAMCENFASLKGKGPFDLAIMPIGAYNTWIGSHCTPEEAVTMANAAGAKHILPVHHQTFILGNEPITEPIERFKIALQNEPERIALRNVGETFVLN